MQSRINCKRRKLRCQLLCARKHKLAKMMKKDLRARMIASAFFARVNACVIYMNPFRALKLIKTSAP